MKTRIITGLTGVPILIGLLYIGGSILLTSIYVFAMIGLKEFFTATCKSKSKLYGSNIVYIGTTIYYLGLMFFGTERLDHTKFTIFILVLFLISLMNYTINHEKMKLKDLTINMFAFIYIPSLFSLIYLISAIDVNNIYIWLIFILAFASDTGAYFTGKAFGKTKLVPKLSPNKTVEGAIGGVIFTIIGVYIYIFILNYLNVLEIEMIKSQALIIVMSGMGSVISQFGDLTSSAIKREYGIKDYGKLMPGHGGVLDRFDSVLFTTMYVYIIVSIIFGG